MLLILTVGELGLFEMALSFLSISQPRMHQLENLCVRHNDNLVRIPKHLQLAKFIENFKPSFGN